LIASALQVVGISITLVALTLVNPILGMSIAGICVTALGVMLEGREK
jgi:hypothetical protein